MKDKPKKNPLKLLKKLRPETLFAAIDTELPNHTLLPYTEKELESAIIHGEVPNGSIVAVYEFSNYTKVDLKKELAFTLTDSGQD